MSRPIRIPLRVADIRYESYVELKEKMGENVFGLPKVKLDECSSERGRRGTMDWNELKNSRGRGLMEALQNALR